MTIFQVDERVAPDGDPDRNLTPDRGTASRRRRCAPPPRCPCSTLTSTPPPPATRRQLPERLDLVHLGLGPDGHTASLVPGDPVLEVGDRRVALTAGEYQGRRRMTLTYPALDAARRILWLVAGEDKRRALELLLEGDRSIPAGRVAAADAIVICDRAAAG